MSTATGHAQAPIRVLHICRRYRPFTGGTEKYVHDLAVAQARAGRVVTILTLDRDVVGATRNLPHNETLEGLRVVRVPGRGSAQIAVSYRPDRIWREIARHDVVHLHDLRFGLASAVVSAAIRRKPRILHTHGLIFHSGSNSRFKRLAMRLYFGPMLRLGGFRVVASSEADRLLLLREAPYLDSRAITFPNAIPLAPLLALERSPVKGRVVSIGKIVPNKALGDLVAAMARLKDVDWSLMLAGEADQRELARIQADAARLGIADRVRYVLGFAEDEMPGLLASAELAAFPSRGEGFGIALLEAMAAGVPLLANRIPAHEALLGTELAGQLVDFADPEAAAGAMRSALRVPRRKQDELSDRLRKRAGDYDISRLVGQIDDLYDRLGVKPHGKGAARPGGEAV